MVVRAAYAPTEPDTGAADGVTADATAVLHRLRELTSLRRRLVGLYRRA
jgi:hypothetical protein